MRQAVPKSLQVSIAPHMEWCTASESQECVTVQRVLTTNDIVCDRLPTCLSVVFDGELHRGPRRLHFVQGGFYGELLAGRLADLGNYRRVLVQLLLDNPDINSQLPRIFYGMDHRL